MKIKSIDVIPIYPRLAKRYENRKIDLYGTISQKTSAVVLSGANLDDLGDYRPGLQAAREHSVRHPFVEAGVDKSTIRTIARYLGFADLAALPAAPCLASRIETGIEIEPRLLRAVHAVEQHVAGALEANVVRCRVRKGGVIIELDELASLRLFPRRVALHRCNYRSNSGHSLIT